MLPDLIAHADWGSFAHNRILASARLTKDNFYLAKELEEVPKPESLLNELRRETSSDGAILVGFDFPIGLPVHYAKQNRINNFLNLLPHLGNGQWCEFYTIAEKAEQISHGRPFYPKAPGGTLQEHLVNGLGVRSFEDLRRQCEKKGQGRTAATPLFWTLGPSQVGRGAIIGWRDMLAPALTSTDVDIKIWPFQGSLIELIASARMVVAETYPSEFRYHLGIRNGKTQESRMSSANAILKLANLVELVIPDSLKELIRNGFGNGKSSRDYFDAFVGLIGMLNVIKGNRSEGVPDDEAVREIEGWILGRSIV